jgi:hypothetical protein
MLSIMRKVRADLAPDVDVVGMPITPEEELEQRRYELRNGLTDMQRLFLLGKLGGLNDKDAALAAGYSLSVSENTKQRIWKPKVLREFERLAEVVDRRRTKMLLLVGCSEKVVARRGDTN